MPILLEWARLTATISREVAMPINENAPRSRYGFAAPAFFVLTAFFLTAAIVSAFYAAWIAAGTGFILAVVFAWGARLDMQRYRNLPVDGSTIEDGLWPEVPAGDLGHEPLGEPDAPSSPRNGSS